MIYSKEFVEVVDSALKPYKNFYIGTGNPNSNILLIGKEAAINEKLNNFEEKNLKDYINNAKEWKENIESEISEVDEWIAMSYKDIKNNPLHLFKGVRLNEHKEGVTWRKYQKLFDVIMTGEFNKETNRAYNFQSNMFITEMNDAPNNHTSDADKTSLENRKVMFQHSSFYQRFPVTILACSNYIWNTNDDRQIDRTFHVKYAGDEEGKHVISKGNWFFVHYNDDKTKLVIHTRQLSMDVRDDLIFKMGMEIRKFLLKKNLIK